MAIQGRERIGAHPTLAIDRYSYHPLPSEPQQPQRLENGDVNLVADDNRYRRRPEQPIRLDVPASRRQHGVTGRGQGREIRHRGTGDNAAPLSTGSPRRPTNHRRATSSKVALIGQMEAIPASWSQAAASQLAASAAGSVPPLT